VGRTFPTESEGVIGSRTGTTPRGGKKRRALRAKLGSNGERPKEKNRKRAGEPEIVANAGKNQRKAKKATEGLPNGPNMGCGRGGGGGWGGWEKDRSRLGFGLKKMTSYRY